MKCKYWDCGWCYAPENVKTNATQGGCFEPEYCPYKKSQMTNQQPPYGIVYIPQEGRVPNRFVRWMMRICFDCMWVEEK